jgi:hypothetical protein
MVMEEALSVAIETRPTREAKGSNRSLFDDDCEKGNITPMSG